MVYPVSCTAVCYVTVITLFIKKSWGGPSKFVGGPDPLTPSCCALADLNDLYVVWRVFAQGAAFLGSRCVKIFSGVIFLKSWSFLNALTPVWAADLCPLTTFRISQWWRIRKTIPMRKLHFPSNAVLIHWLNSASCFISSIFLTHDSYSRCCMTPLSLVINAFSHRDGWGHGSGERKSIALQQLDCVAYTMHQCCLLYTSPSPRD